MIFEGTKANLKKREREGLMKTKETSIELCAVQEVQPNIYS